MSSTSTTTTGGPYVVRPNLSGTTWEPPPVTPVVNPHRDFLIWLNGALDVLSETPPTQEQWDKLRARVADEIGADVAQRIRELAAKDFYDAQPPVPSERLTQQSTENAKLAALLKASTFMKGIK